MLEFVEYDGIVCTAEGAGKGAVIMGAVGATAAGCLTPSIATAGAAFIGATGAGPALFLRSAPAVAPDLSYFFSVSLRNCLDSFARALYSPTLRSESSAVSTSAVVCSEISGRASFALMASDANAALNILFLDSGKGRFSTLQTRDQSKRHCQNMHVLSDRN